MKKVILPPLMVLCLAVAAWASGFNIYEFGARASAMGGAVSARAWDASTIFYNPSGIAFLEGGQFYGGPTLILPSTKFVGAAPMFDATVHKAVKQVFPPTGVFLSYKFSERVAAGVGFTTPFGLGLKWEKDFPGRGLSRNVDLKSFYVHGVLAFELLPNFSIGGGVDLVKSEVLLERNVYIFDSPGSPGTEVGEVSLEASSDWTVGFSAGLMYRGERFGLGAMYRHKVKNEYSGTADFTIFDNLPVPNIAAVAAEILKDQKGSTEITFPNILTYGAYFGLSDRLGAEVDVNIFNWSVFDQVVLDFEDDALDTVIPENYTDAFEVRVGVHYDLNENFSLLGGYIYDTTPQPIESVSPLLPDDTRHDFSAGFSYRSGRFRIDAGYMFVSIGERTTVENGIGRNDFGFNGTYNSHANLFFGSLGINF